MNKDILHTLYARILRNHRNRKLSVQLVGSNLWSAKYTAIIIDCFELNVPCSYTVVANISWIFLILHVKDNLFILCVPQYLLLSSLLLQAGSLLENINAAKYIPFWALLSLMVF